MKVKVFIQARTSSSRLPAKVLLPIKGIPVAVVAARRAGNTGLDVTVLTSDDASDDCLTDILANNNVSFFRGALKDVLSRYHAASKDLNDGDLIVRLTSDNIIPDGEILDLALAFYLQNNCQYLKSSDSFPYGLSFEIFSVSQLRQAAALAKEEFDREHVTPFIRRENTISFFDDTQFHYEGRVTIDLLDDYLVMVNLFSRYPDPVLVKSSELVQALMGISKNNRTAERLIAGGAQLGLKYGISSSADYSEDQAIELVQQIQKNHFWGIDTASAYGNSERVIGKALSRHSFFQPSVISKLTPDLSDDLNEYQFTVKLFESFLNSLRNLEKHNIEILMLHRSQHAFLKNGLAVDILRKLKTQGWIKKVGVSISTPEEFLGLYKNEIFEVVQLPYNIFDFRWDHKEILNALSEFRTRGGSIHVRSVFLQGLIFLNNSKNWPIISDNYNAEDILYEIQKLEKNKNTEISHICLQYVLSQEWIDKLIVGMQNVEQIIETLRKTENVIKIGKEELKDLRKLIPIDLLNPALWKTKI